MDLEALTGPCIVTKYLGPTDYRGSRIKATHTRDSETKWSKTVGYDSALDSDKNHERAAQALIDSWPFNEHFKFVLKGRGHDHNHYYFIADIEQEANP
ncbi:hypothetical protein CMK19_00110 [Candidatus Poribacteria bacterium]|nr:hypothetical protein [Candidatus Poribacteria bacterium]|tara:strand:- start:219 stop:512 length:294 start_codon:yes stop_codon:yes gene_type:complete